MTESRPASGLLVSALIRRIQNAGGSAMVLAKGDAIAGAILLLLADRGIARALVERQWHHDGGYRLVAVGPEDVDESGPVADYIARRRRSDPDLWVVELDHPAAGELAGAMA